MKLENIKAAIFDIDGTLLDSMPIWKDAATVYLKSIGLEPEPNLSEIIFTMTIKEGIRYSKEHYHIDKTEDEIEQGLLDTIRDFYYYDAQAKPGVIKLVKSLYDNNIPMVLATTGNEDLARHALERVGIMQYFKGLLTCNDLNTNKGEPLVFEMSVENLEKELGLAKGELKYENVYVFEDSLKAIKTVKNMGFSVVAVKDAECKNSFDEIRKTAGVLLDSLEEVSL